jgi:DNA-directed RNA polymerase specialized sigma24 family protein
METTRLEPSSSLATLFAALPEEERAILTLHYVHDHSIVEIASTLSVAPKAVEAVLKAGKARLAAALGIG